MIKALLIFLSIACCFGCGHDITSEQPNILLIVADDLGYTDLGCYGSEIRTPHLDALAEAGIRNTAFYTAPTCSPTRAMLLTGVDNHRNGYGTMEGDWATNQEGVRGYEGHLNFDVVTFPRLLSDHGYHTSIAGKWHQAFPANDTTLWPHKRGFDRSFCIAQGGAGHFSDQQRMFNFYDRSYYIEDGRLVDQLPGDFYSTDFYTTKALEYIDESQELNKPFFTYVAYTAPHWPLQAPDDAIDLYKGQYDMGYEVLAQTRLEGGKAAGTIPREAELPALTPNVVPWDTLSADEKRTSSRIMEVYAAMIERMDANVGRLIDHLKSIGQYDNTLIVFLADNGPEGNWVGAIVDTEQWVAETFDNSFKNIGRPNSYVYTGPSWAQVSSLPFKWYKGFSSEGGVRCPSIISYPAWRHTHGTIHQNYLSVMDLAPTFLEITGIEHPGSEYEGRTIYPMDGTSMLGWLKGDVGTVHALNSIHCAELYGRRSVRKGKWKAEWLDAPYGTDAWALYDLEQDPGEQHNLATAHPNILNTLLEAWDQYVDEYNLVLPSEKVAYTADRIWN